MARSHRALAKSTSPNALLHLASHRTAVFHLLDNSSSRKQALSAAPMWHSNLLSVRQPRISKHQQRTLSRKRDQKLQMHHHHLPKQPHKIQVLFHRLSKPHLPRRPCLHKPPPRRIQYPPRQGRLSQRIDLKRETRTSMRARRAKFSRRYIGAWHIWVDSRITKKFHLHHRSVNGSFH